MARKPAETCQKYPFYPEPILSEDERIHLRVRDQQELEQLRLRELERTIDENRKNPFFLETRKKIQDAIDYIQERGFLSRQDYLCCDVHAGISIYQLVLDMDQEHQCALNGILWWCRQDENFYWATGILPVSYSSVISPMGTKITPSTEEIGCEIFEILLSFGLIVDWDFLPESKIQILAEYH